MIARVVLVLQILLDANKESLLLFLNLLLLSLQLILSFLDLGLLELLHFLKCGCLLGLHLLLHLFVVFSQGLVVHLDLMEFLVFNLGDFFDYLLELPLEVLLKYFLLGLDLVPNISDSGLDLLFVFCPLVFVHEVSGRLGEDVEVE